MAAEAPGNTLSATALVHEAYLRLVGPVGSAKPEPQSGIETSVRSDPTVRAFDGRGHFFAAAAESMRRILVDRARQKAAAKRGGELTRIELKADLAAAPEIHEDLVALDSALDRLAAEYPQQAELVKMRYFGGMTLPDAAAALGISERTAGRQWAFARAWLRRAVEGAEERN
jgi:RNA polymerase sigma factor (TIGR02999 family)